MNNIVMEIDGKRAVVMNRSGDFFIVGNRNYRVGQRLDDRELRFVRPGSPATPRVRSRYTFGGIRSNPVSYQNHSGGKSMKKVRVIIVAVSVALMLMGVGYAAWGQALPTYVYGSTAGMDVQYYTAHAEAVNYIKVGDNAPYYNNGPQISADKKWMSVTIRNIYPSSQVTIHATIKNNSAMPVYMTNVAFNRVNGPDVVLDNIGVDFSGNTYWLSGNQNAACNIGFAPGEVKDFYFTVKMYAGAPDDTTENKSFEISVIPSFVSNK